MPSVPNNTACAGGAPGDARNIPITAVKTISETPRGFVSARNWRKRWGARARVVMDGRSAGGSSEQGIAHCEARGADAEFYHPAPQSADLRGAQEAREVVGQFLDVGIGRPCKNRIAERIDQVDTVVE